MIILDKNTNTDEDDDLTLMSLEKLDRESPDLWPEKSE